MKKNYYLFNPGRMSRKDNTLKFIFEDENGNANTPKYLPIESIKSLYVFGSIDANSALFNFLGKSQVPVHFFDYYEHYTGSFHPKEYLLAGKMQVAQTQTFLKPQRRLHIAQMFIEGAGFNILQNIKYYNRRKIDLTEHIVNIERYLAELKNTTSPSEIMGLEGNCRMTYYASWSKFLDQFEMKNREKRPPSNEINALISFGNMMMYSECLDQIYHTQLNPTISFLHEPGYRRFSLALDISEIFKPIIVDRIIFKLINKKEIREEHFERKLNGCYLKENGKKIFIQSFEDKLKETIKHRTLKRSVSFAQLIRLECYKISKYILKIEPEYKPFKIWW